MTDLTSDFAERAKEITICLRKVAAISDAAADDESHLAARALRAAVYLLTYNLIEATARNAVVAIFDHLSAERVSFDKVRKELKVFVLKSVKKKKPKELSDRLIEVASDIFAAAFDPEELFSGNVDARKLRQTAKEVGFNDRVRANGDVLLTIKERRNDLAHGLKTFSEVGRDVSVQDLRTQVARAIRYMRGVVRNVSNFVEQADYLA